LRAYKQGARTVSVALVGEKRMRALNKKYRGRDRTTDVLAFPARTATGPGRGKGPRAGGYLGEVVVNLGAVKKSASYRDLFLTDKKPAYILAFVLVHGLLHLLGYDDKTAAGQKLMLKKGREFLARFRPGGL